MPDKHEVGGSTPLEPTSRQGRQPVVGELKPEYGSHRTMGTDAGGKISEARRKRGKAKDREHIQRISGIRESDLRRLSRKPARPASRGSAGEKTEAKKKNAGKEKIQGPCGKRKAESARRRGSAKG